MATDFVSFPDSLSLLRSSRVQEEAGPEQLAASSAPDLDRVGRQGVTSPSPGGVGCQTDPLPQPGQADSPALHGPACLAEGAVADFPLGLGQEQLWLFEQLVNGTSVYTVPESWWLRGSLDIKSLELALQDLVERHEPLRTTFVLKGTVPQQRVQRRPEFTLQVVDLEHSGAPEARAVALANRQGRTAIPLLSQRLFHASLLRLSPDHHLLVLTLHHAICDEWSLNILRRDLGALYTARIRNERPSLPDLPIQFADFAVWQRERENTKPATDHEFWKKQIAQGLLGTPLTCGESKAASTLTYAGETLFRRLPADLSEELLSFTQASKTTLYCVLLAAFKALLHRWTRQNDIVIGAPFANREPLETENLVGFFVSTLPLRTTIAEEDTFQQVVERVRTTCLEAQSHPHAPPELLLSGAHADRRRRHHPIHSILFALQPAMDPLLELPGVKTEKLDLDNGGSKFELSLLITKTGRSFHLRCEYSTELLERWFIESVLDSFLVLLRAAMRHPETRIADLPLTSHSGPLGHAAGAPQAYSTVQQMFEQACTRYPDRTALVTVGGQWTYAELCDRVHRWTGALLPLTAGQNCPVGLCLPRTADLVTGILAILSAGAAYVPLDPKYPRARLQYMLSDSSAPVLICSEETSEWCECTSGVVRLLPKQLDDSPVSGPPSILGAASDLAYLIYTSGSTGRPKGVALEHKGAVALIQWAEKHYLPGDLAGVLAGTSVCFDLSIFEILVTLCLGGTVVLADDVLSLVGHPAAGRVTMLNTVPSAIRELVRSRGVPPNVKVVNLAGEPLPQKLVDEIYANTGVERVYDLYGPTETTTYSTVALRTAGGRATIGRALQGERLYVLDSQLRPLPFGMPGELHIGGIGLARGYWRQENLTRERFVLTPAGTRLYRTGDLGRELPDGTFEFIGRMDAQVKLRGHRIELGEIESVLRATDELAEAIVVCRPDAAGEAELVAYIKAKEAAVPIGPIRERLASLLPAFMVPNRFVWLDKIPLTTNGKIDRTALPPPQNAIANQPHGVPPRTELEQRIACIWGEVLGQKTLGVLDNFFHQGGHSLLAMRVVSMLTEELGVSIPLRTLFDAPTIESFAAALARPPAKSADPGAKLVRTPSPAQEAQELLARLDELSDEEVDALLARSDTRKLLQ